MDKKDVPDIASIDIAQMVEGAVDLSIAADRLSLLAEMFRGMHARGMTIRAPFHKGIAYSDDPELLNILNEVRK